MQMKTKMISISIIVLTLAVAFLLEYGSPQSCKWIYMHQVYGWPFSSSDSESREYGPPENYTGNWVIWSENGRRVIESNYINGRAVGIDRTFNDEGEVLKWTSYAPNSGALTLNYSSNGTFKRITFEDGNRHEDTYFINEDGSIDTKEIFVGSKNVTYEDIQWTGEKLIGQMVIKTRLVDVYKKFKYQNGVVVNVEEIERISFNNSPK